MNTLLNEMQRYLQVIERAEADPEVWGKLTEGTGIATANGYRAALKAAAQPVAPEQRTSIVAAIAGIITKHKTTTDRSECAAEKIVALFASLPPQQVKGYSVDEVRDFPQWIADTKRKELEEINRQQDEGSLCTNEAKEAFAAVMRRTPDVWLQLYAASLSAKGEAAHPSFDVIDKYGATHLIEKVPGTEVELSHLRHDQSVVSGDSKTFHYRLTKVDVDKGEAPKEDAPEWWCAHCQHTVDPRNVTFEERHDKCGCLVTITPEGAVSAPVEDREGQPFEKYPALSAAIEYGANNWRINTGWTELLQEINATITTLEAVAPSGVVEALGLVRRAQAIIQAFHVYKANPDTGIVMDWLHDAAALTQWEASQPSPDSPKN